MPIKPPTLDQRSYQDLRDEALSRVRVHTPEWTSFNESDPGVTIVELFAFLTEALIYRANLIPERNRQKFLSLLGVPLLPATAARGLVTFTNERGAARRYELPGGLEVRAGEVPFRTERGLDVLPIEARVFYKQPAAPVDRLKAYYKQLYRAYADVDPPADLSFYRVVELPARPLGGVFLRDTQDTSLWIAILLRDADKPWNEARKAEIWKQLAGRTLSLGVVPAIAQQGKRLGPGQDTSPEAAGLLQFLIPNVARDGSLGPARAPSYRALDAAASTNVLIEPGIVEVALPSSAQIPYWNDIDPVEAGVGDLPPSLEDTNLAQRLITWVRVQPAAPADVGIFWIGANAAAITQRTRVQAEVLPDGSGEPDQSAQLGNRPIIPGSVRLTVAPRGAAPEEWTRIDDLMNARPEVDAPDPRLAPGSPRPDGRRDKVFAEDAEAGVLRFGDGARGRRPPLGARIVASYDHAVGRQGNVGADAITTAPSLPAGLKVTNAVPTWGGADAETASAGEKQIARYLRHRDRLVTKSDFEVITLRTPGVSVGRVEVLPAYSPALGSNEPGDVPGVVTLMVLPSYDPAHPEAPEPSRDLIEAVAAWIEPRRVVTTEVFVRGPTYRDLWVSLGITVVPGQSPRDVSERVKDAVRQFLSPLPHPGVDLLAEDPPPTDGVDPSLLQVQRGWPLRKPVVDLEILAVASRVAGVLSVKQVIVGDAAGKPKPTIELTGLMLPRLAQISVSIGDAVDLDVLRGTGPAVPLARNIVPVPVIPEDCR